MNAYDGKYCRVVLEGKVEWNGLAYLMGEGDWPNRIHPEAEHFVSIEQITRPKLKVGQDVSLHNFDQLPEGVVVISLPQAAVPLWRDHRDQWFVGGSEINVAQAQNYLRYNTGKLVHVRELERAKA